MRFAFEWRYPWMNVRAWAEALWMAARLFPYVIRDSLGRWHIWRDAPLDLVQEMARFDDDDTELGSMAMQAKSELALRKRRGEI